MYARAQSLQYTAAWPQVAAQPPAVNGIIESAEKTPQRHVIAVVTHKSGQDHHRVAVAERRDPAQAFATEIEGNDFEYGPVGLGEG